MMYYMAVFGAREPRLPACDPLCPPLAAQARLPESVCMLCGDFESKGAQKMAHDFKDHRNWRCCISSSGARRVSRLRDDLDE